jgi:hypothetical protein
MSRENCEKCIKRAGSPYRFYYGKMSRTVSGSYLTTHYEVSGYKDTILCDKCVMKHYLLWGVLGLLPAFLLFFLAMLPFTKSEPWNESDYLGTKICLLIGLSWLVVLTLVIWLVAKFGDKQKRGARAAKDFWVGKGFGGYNVFWLTPPHSLLNSNQKLP